MPDFTYEEKRDIQREELNILREFKALCDRHGLSYYIVAGTLLGAARHKGFIPWDDDADVAMPRRDYEKLAKIAGRELPANMVYQSEKTERECPFGFAKIRNTDTAVSEKYLKNAKMSQGVYIDIFPLDKCPASDRRATRYFKLTNMCYCAMLSKIDKTFKHGYEKGSARAAFKLIRLMPLGMIKSLRRSIRRYYSLLSRGKLLATTSGSYGYPRESYSAEWLGEGVLLPFEGELLRAPKEWDKVLTHMYGDYMTPPAENERGGHLEK
ncbi:MAG: LicD family protein [Clostridia bacterium]|nr:LicD family protein [Clostridia bacterium]